MLITQCTFPQIVCMFFIYSFFGWIIEVIYYGVTEGRFINRGFLNGPLCPVYGFGFLTAVYFLEPIKDQYALIFFGTATACTIVELIAGIILYQLFHMRWWDYSTYKLNFKGYICFRFFLYWGIAASLGLYVLHPAVLKFVGLFPEPVLIGIDGLFELIFIFDLVMSVATIIGFSNKLQTFSKISATVKTASDYIGGNIYGTVDTIITVESPIKDSYDAYRKLVNEHKAEENELAKKHRQEEQEYFRKFLSSGKDAAGKTKDIASEKMFSIVKGFNYYEKKLLRNINISSMSTAYDKAISIIKNNYFKRTKDDDPHKMVAEEPELAVEVTENEDNGSV